MIDAVIYEKGHDLHFSYDQARSNYKIYQPKDNIGYSEKRRKQTNQGNFIPNTDENGRTMFKMFYHDYVEKQLDPYRENISSNPKYNNIVRPINEDVVDIDRAIVDWSLEDSGDINYYNPMKYYRIEKQNVDPGVIIIEPYVSDFLGALSYLYTNAIFSQSMFAIDRFKIQAINYINYEDLIPQHINIDNYKDTLLINDNVLESLEKYLGMNIYIYDAIFKPRLLDRIGRTFISEFTETLTYEYLPRRYRNSEMLDNERSIMLIRTNKYLIRNNLVNVDNIQNPDQVYYKENKLSDRDFLVGGLITNVQNPNVKIHFHSEEVEEMMKNAKK